MNLLTMMCSLSWNGCDIPCSWALVTFYLLKCTLRSEASSCNMATTLAACTIWNLRMDWWPRITGWRKWSWGILCSSCTCRWSGFVLVDEMPFTSSSWPPPQMNCGLRKYLLVKDQCLFTHVPWMFFLWACSVLLWSQEALLHFLDTLLVFEQSRLLSVGSLSQTIWCLSDPLYTDLHI